MCSDFCPRKRLLWHSWGPKKGPCWPKKSFWGPQRSFSIPRGPDLGLTAISWSNWIGVMLQHTLTWYQGFFIEAKGPKGPFLFKRCQMTKIGSQQARWPPFNRILLAGMLTELTLTYWAYISAARAPKGIFGPNPLSFVAPLLAEFYFGRSICMLLPTNL